MGAFSAISGALGEDTDAQIPIEITNVDLGKYPKGSTFDDRIVWAIVLTSAYV